VTTKQVRLGTHAITVSAGFQPDYDSEIQRWRWMITRHGQALGWSFATFPSEHDAMEATRTLHRQLKAGAR
jgi:hypothetical protein